MKVKELIEKLEKLDPNAEVITHSSNFELRGADVAISSVWQYNTGRFEIKTYVDAFDYAAYEKKVFFITGGDLPVVYIS